MRLYLFECGSLLCDKALLTMNRGWGAETSIPVQFFLIQHSRGNLLFDTGNAAQVAVNSRAHWGPVVDVYQPVMSSDQYCVNQLASIGIKLSEVGNSGDPLPLVAVEKRNLERTNTSGWADWFRRPWTGVVVN